jgi:transposase-like protein
MNHSVYYHQNCPICGRMLRVGVSLLGQQVYCQHCGGSFLASDTAMTPAAEDGLDSERVDLQRVERLLEQAEEVLSQHDEEQRLEAVVPAPGARHG